MFVDRAGERSYMQVSRGALGCLVHSKSCMEKGLEGNLLQSCFCLYLLLLMFWLKERKQETEMQLEKRRGRSRALAFGGISCNEIERRIC